MSIANRCYESSGGSNGERLRFIAPYSRGESRQQTRYTTAPSEALRGSQIRGCVSYDTRDTAPVCTDTPTTTFKPRDDCASTMGTTSAHTCETTSTAKRLAPAHTRLTRGFETFQDTRASDSPVTQSIGTPSDITISPEVCSSLGDLLTLQRELGPLTPEQAMAFSVRLNKILRPEGLQIVPTEVIDQSNDLASALKELDALRDVESRYEEQTNYTAALESKVETLNSQVKELDRLRKLAEDKLALVERSQAAR